MYCFQEIFSNYLGIDKMTFGKKHKSKLEKIMISLFNYIIKSRINLKFQNSYLKELNINIK